MPRMLRGRDVVCVGSVGWRAPLWTEEHHLAARLGRDNRVLYVEPPRADRTRLSGPLGSGLGLARPAPGVEVLIPPAVGAAPGRPLRAWLVRRAVRRRGLRDVLLYAFTPDAAELLDAVAPAHVVYHCRRAWPATDAERRLARRADVALAAAPALVARLRELGAAAPRPALAAADTTTFARALAAGSIDPAIDALPRPRIVVTGEVAARTLDVALVAALAALRPRWQIALVGPVGAPGGSALAPLREAPNIHLLGEREHATMPEVLRGADAALVPVRLTPETATMAPMCVYEHLAAGLPVVATPLPALAGLRDVRFAEQPLEVAAALDELLADDDLEARRARSAAVAGHSWDTRLEQLAAALREAT